MCSGSFKRKSKILWCETLYESTSPWKHYVTRLLETSCPIFNEDANWWETFSVDERNLNLNGPNIDRFYWRDLSYDEHQSLKHITGGVSVEVGRFMVFTMRIFLLSFIKKNRACPSIWRSCKRFYYHLRSICLVDHHPCFFSMMVLPYVSLVELLNGRRWWQLLLHSGPQELSALTISKSFNLWWNGEATMPNSLSNLKHCAFAKSWDKTRL